MSKIVAPTPPHIRVDDPSLATLPTPQNNSLAALKVIYKELYEQAKRLGVYLDDLPKPELYTIGAQGLTPAIPLLPLPQVPTIPVLIPNTPAEFGPENQIWAQRRVNDTIRQRNESKIEEFKVDPIEGFFSSTTRMEWSEYDGETTINGYTEGKVDTIIETIENIQAVPEPPPNNQPTTEPAPYRPLPVRIRRRISRLPPIRDLELTRGGRLGYSRESIENRPISYPPRPARWRRLTLNQKKKFLFLLLQLIITGVGATIARPSTKKIKGYSKDLSTEDLKQLIRDTFAKGAQSLKALGWTMETVDYEIDYVDFDDIEKLHQLLLLVQWIEIRYVLDEKYSDKNIASVAKAYETNFQPDSIRSGWQTVFWGMLQTAYDRLQDMLKGNEEWLHSYLTAGIGDWIGPNEMIAMYPRLKDKESFNEWVEQYPKLGLQPKQLDSLSYIGQHGAVEGLEKFITDTLFLHSNNSPFSTLFESVVRGSNVLLEHVSPTVTMANSEEDAMNNSTWNDQERQVYEANRHTFGDLYYIDPNLIDGFFGFSNRLLGWWYHVSQETDPDSKALVTTPSTIAEPTLTGIASAVMYRKGENLRALVVNSTGEVFTYCDNNGQICVAVGAVIGSLAVYTLTPEGVLEQAMAYSVAAGNALVLAPLQKIKEYIKSINTKTGEQFRFASDIITDGAVKLGTAYWVYTHQEQIKLSLLAGVGIGTGGLIWYYAPSQKGRKRKR